MIFKAILIWDKDDDNVERKLELTTSQFSFMIRHCHDLNSVADFIDLLLEHKKERYHTGSI